MTVQELIDAFNKVEDKSKSYGQTMTVQELIDALNKVEDKSKSVFWDANKESICYLQDSSNFVYLY